MASVKNKCGTARVMLSAALLLATTAVSSDRLAAQAQADLMQVHIGHVMDSFKDTPKQQGLLPTALEEANTALQHAALAAKSSANLDAMKLHASHVIHAIDPTLEAKGPGLGYGVKKAAAAVAQHIELAGKAPTASTHAKTQALYAARWANNVVTWSDEVVDVANRIRTATAVAQAADLVQELTALTEQLTAGVPAVGRFDAQGGLQQAQERMEQMRKGSGQ
jgi:hypothetical protein